MHKSEIVEEEGYLGLFRRKLKVGGWQDFVFKEADDGPFWMSKSEQQNRRCDRYTGKMLQKQGQSES